MSKLNLRKTKDCIEYLSQMKKACEKDIKRTTKQKRIDKLNMLSDDITTFIKELKTSDEKKLNIEQCEKLVSLSSRGLVLAGLKKEKERFDESTN